LLARVEMVGAVDKSYLRLLRYITGYTEYTCTLYHKDDAKNTRYINSPIKDYHLYFHAVFFVLDKNYSTVLYVAAQS